MEKLFNMIKEKILKRDLILDTAFVLFIENGYSDTKIIDIAEAAGIGKGTVYEYFESKEKLFFDLFKCKVADGYKDLSNILNKELSCEEKIKEYIEYEKKMTTKFGFHKNMHLEILLKSEAFQNPELVRAIHELIGFKFSIIYQIIEEGIRKCEFIKVDPLMAATAIIGAINFFLRYNCNTILSMANLPLAKCIEWDCEELCRLIFSGLKA